MRTVKVTDVEPDIQRWVLARSGKSALSTMKHVQMLHCVTRETTGSSPAEMVDAITTVFRRCLPSQPALVKSDIAVLRHLCRVEGDTLQGTRNSAAAKCVPSEHKLKDGETFRKSKYYKQLLRQAAAILMTEEHRVLGERADSEPSDPAQPLSGIPLLPAAGEVERLIAGAQQGLVDRQLSDGLGQADEAILAAMAAGETELELRARRLAIRILLETVNSQDPDSQVPHSHRVAEHLDALVRLGESQGNVAVLELKNAMAQPSDSSRVLDLAETAYEAAVAAGDTRNAAELAIYWLQSLWRTGDLDTASAVCDRAEETVRQLEEDTELRMMLSACLLRTRCRTEPLPDGAVAEWCEELTAAVATGDEVTAERGIIFLGEMAHDLSSHGHLADAVRPCRLSAQLAESIGNPAQCASINLQTAEVLAYSGNQNLCEKYLQAASTWLLVVQNEASEEDWLQAQVASAFTKGRCKVTLSEDSRNPFGLLSRALEDLNLARDLLASDQSLHEAAYLESADIEYWLGRTLRGLGRHRESAEAFGRVHTERTMENRRFAIQRGALAWLLEAEDLLASGDIRGASTVVKELLAKPGMESIRQQATKLSAYIDDVCLPLPTWLSSPDASKIGEEAAAATLDRTVAQITRPLVSWWDVWKVDSSAPLSELFDFWGRGGFARIVAAIRARPHAAAIVDAYSIDDIRKWCRILCPLFEVVVVKWKGELGSGFTMTPMARDYGGPDSFGGYGYMVSAGLIMSPNADEDGEQWSPAMAWANPIPSEVSTFLAGEADALFRAGRLVLLPAPLVGCTQHSAGWSDQLLVDGLLGGAVNATRLTTGAREADTGRRVLDLSSHSIPYIDGVELKDLAAVLEDCEEWVAPFRAMTLQVLADGGLRDENWSNISALENDFRDASRLMGEGLQRLAGDRWSVETRESAISVGSRGPDSSDREVITDLLRAVVSDATAVSPWVPYFRMTGLGGHLKWSDKLDNPSTPKPDSPPGESQYAHSWLRPGNAGWTIPTMVLPTE
jgi:tetratricopeptide (TPR) repeat protein